MKKVFFVAFLLMTLPVFPQDLNRVWNDGIEKFKKKDFLGFYENLNLMIKYITDNPGIYYNRGVARLNMGDQDGACADFAMAEKLGFKENKTFRNFQCNPMFKLKFLEKGFYPDTKLYEKYGWRPAYTLKDTLRGSLRPERTCYDVYFYDLTVRIIPHGKKITGNNKIYFQVMDTTHTIQIDLFDNLNIQSIKWNNKNLAYKRIYDAVFVNFPEQLRPGSKEMISVSYGGKPGIAENPPWQGGFVWKRDKNRNRWVAVACEQLGASSWWPVKDHLSDEPDSMQINMEVPKKYKAVCNGNLRAVVPADKKYNRFEWFVSYPINSYDVTFYMGNYVGFTDTLFYQGDTLLMQYNVLPYHLDTAKKYFQQAKEVVAYYSDIYGRFPFWRDGYSLVESPYEGMENQTAIAYGNNFDKKVNHDYRNGKYDDIIVHETAHEWWGNAVTAADMADAWIHEGFATYSEYLFLGHMFGNDEYLYEVNNKLNYIFNFWPMVENYGVNENSFASNDIYTKGATLLHCLRCTINNDSLFFKILKGFFTKYEYKEVNSDDFISFVNKQTGESYNAFFDKYLHDNRLPVLSYTYKKEGKDIIFTYKWDQVEKGFKMPFALATDSDAVRLEGTTSDQTIRLKNTSTFNFYNQFFGYKGAPDNSFTYYWTADRSN